MWTPTTRRRHSRVGLRNRPDRCRVGGDQSTDAGACAVWSASGLDDAGDPERHLLRPARRYRVAADPQGPAPRSTAFGYFSRWRDTGLFARINHHLVMADRE